MGALGHSVSIAVLRVAEATTGDNTVGLEPSPGSGNLTSIAVVGEALGAVAAGSSVSSGKEALISNSSGLVDSGNAVSVVEGLSGAVSPA
jgi:hypothetical protein